MIQKGCFHVGSSLCKLHYSNIFVGRAVFDVDVSHILFQAVLAIIRLIGVTTGVAVSRECTDVLDKASLLCGCHSPVRGRICSPVFGLEALRVKFSKSLLPLNVCSVPKDVTSEVRDSVNLCAAHVGIHGFAQK